MFTMSTYGVATTSHKSVQVFVMCHNRATAEFYLAKFASPNTVLLAPGARFDIDVSHIPSVAWWVTQPRLAVV
jgi:hypothetical protein